MVDIGKNGIYGLSKTLKLKHIIYTLKNRDDDGSLMYSNVEKDNIL